MNHRLHQQPSFLHLLKTNPQKVEVFLKWFSLRLSVDFFRCAKTLLGQGIVVVFATKYGEQYWIFPSLGKYFQVPYLGFERSSSVQQLRLHPNSLHDEMKVLVVYGHHYTPSREEVDVLHVACPCQLCSSGCHPNHVAYYDFAVLLLAVEDHHNSCRCARVVRAPAVCVPLSAFAAPRCPRNALYGELLSFVFSLRHPLHNVD
mmetsp:Transcript_2526/g.3727  ORF Transcript_2526/g.3727 Transcript_2526/m.3727 type:complete len:203 (+) Transcript_2526:10590-11198(+)